LQLLCGQKWIFILLALLTCTLFALYLLEDALV